MLDLIKACETESELDFLQESFMLTDEQKEAVLQQRIILWTNAMAEDIERENPVGVDPDMIANWTEDQRRLFNEDWANDDGLCEELEQLPQPSENQTEELATVLGFDQDTLIEKKTSSPYAADINGGFSSMYVCTDIVDAQFVGDVKVPLLRIVNIEGEYGNTVHATFRNLQYVPVKVNSFETIEVNIKNDQNENVSFEFGKSIATLHFRQKRSQYFI
jgi:uncharacterized protein YeaC (DUF1315 family)